MEMTWTLSCDLQTDLSGSRVQTNEIQVLYHASVWVYCMFTYSKCLKDWIIVFQFVLKYKFDSTLKVQKEKGKAIKPAETQA